MASGHRLVRDPGARGQALEEILGDTLGRAVRVTSVKISPCEHAGRWPSFVLAVELDDGSRLRLFLKEVGQSDHPDKKMSDKEVRMYRDVLRGDDLPVPRFYGERPAPEAGRHELYLEYIDALSLKYRELDAWYRSAEALAGLHVVFADRVEDLPAGELLPRLDAEYFWRWAERARTELRAHLPRLVPRLERILAEYEGVVDILVAQPTTLVHNDLGSRNVLVSGEPEGSRVCIVDWESASLGPGVVDLTHLTSGHEPGPHRRLCRAYFDGLRGTPLLPAGDREAERLVAAGELHRVVYRLGRAGYRGYSREGVGKLIDYAERFRGRL